MRADDRWLEVVRASWEDRCSSKGRRRGVGRRAVGEHLAGHGRRCPLVVLPFLRWCVFRSRALSLSSFDGVVHVHGESSGVERSHLVEPVSPWCH